MRITRKDIQIQLDTLNRVTGDDYELYHNYSGYHIMNSKGYRLIEYSLTAREIYFVLLGAYKVGAKYAL